MAGAARNVPAINSNRVGQRFPGCTSPDLAAGACRCDGSRILWRRPHSVHLRCRRGRYGAKPWKQIGHSFFELSVAASRGWPAVRASPAGYGFAVCDFSFSFALQNHSVGIAPSSGGSFKKGKSGQNAAASAKDRRAFAKRRGQMTHAGLAMMAVRARLGPA